MFGFDTETKDSNDIEPRLQRALEEPLSVVSTEGTPVNGDSIVSVESHSGESYTVDVREGRCDCPDAKYNLDAEQRCKHQFRAEIATGRTPVPVRAVETADVDSCLGDHTQSSVQIFASDGGIIDGETGQEITSDIETETETETETESESVWSRPKPEIDKHGVPTGAHYVVCNDCGIEVTTSLSDSASHRDECQHADSRSAVSPCRGCDELCDTEFCSDDCREVWNQRDVPL